MRRDLDLIEHYPSAVLGLIYAEKHQELNNPKVIMIKAMLLAMGFSEVQIARVVSMFV